MKYGEHCYYCMKAMPKEQLRSCSRCRMVTYCSKDCQTKAWKMHKKGCSSTYRDNLDVQDDAGDSEGKNMHSKLSNWLGFWREHLVNDWVMYGMNVPKYPADHLATHCFLIELDERPGATSVAKSFSMVAGRVVPRADIVKFMEDNHADQRYIDDYEKDQRGNDTVQMVVHGGGLMRMVWFNLRDIEERRKKKSRQSMILADALENAWEDALIATIESGDPKNAKMFLQQAAHGLFAA